VYVCVCIYIYIYICIYIYVYIYRSDGDCVCTVQGWRLHKNHFISFFLFVSFFDLFLVHLLIILVFSFDLSPTILLLLFFSFLLLHTSFLLHRVHPTNVLDPLSLFSSSLQVCLPITHFRNFTNFALHLIGGFFTHLSDFWFGSGIWKLRGMGE
jgi:hypothetical protein